MRRFLAITAILLVAPMIRAQEDFDPLDPLDDDAQIGVAVGAKIPDFRAVDQHGKLVGFDAIKGTNGAVLLFHRSADW